MMNVPTADGSKSELQKETASAFDHEHLPSTLGTEFIFRFHRLLKGASIYDPNNDLIDRLTQECLQAINPFIGSEGHLFLKVVRDNFFFNNIRIQVKADRFPIFKTFSREMEKRCIGELEFTGQVAAEDLKNFVYILSGTEEKNESNYLYIQNQLQSKKIQGIHVGKLEFFKDEDLYIDSEEQKRYSKEIYFKAIDLVKEVTDSVRESKIAQHPQSQTPHAKRGQFHHAG